MGAIFKRINPINAGLAVWVVILAVMFVTDLIALVRSGHVTAVASTTDSVDASTRPGPFEHFASVTDRPLFTPSRHSAPVIADSGPTQSPMPELVGIISTGSEHFAFLRSGTIAAAVAPGKVFQGWKLTEIDDGKVHLTGPDGTSVIAATSRGAMPAQSGNQSGPPRPLPGFGQK